MQNTIFDRCHGVLCLGMYLSQETGRVIIDSSSYLYRSHEVYLRDISTVPIRCSCADHFASSQILKKLSKATGSYCGFFFCSWSYPCYAWQCLGNMDSPFRPQVKSSIMSFALYNSAMPIRLDPCIHLEDCNNSNHCYQEYY